MNAGRTARDRARAELTQEIKEQARRQLAVSGAGGLSLRAVARELGMVSSALYRYFSSRDELLTALIIDGYQALGDTAETACRSAEGARAQWRAVCHAIRSWAGEHPHEYALIHGSPVPGYQAPQETVVPASRVPLALIGVVRECWGRGELACSGADRELRPALGRQLSELSASVAPGLPAPLLIRTTMGWAQLFGMISFELFGQFVGSFEPADELFARAIEEMADLIGLP